MEQALERAKEASADCTVRLMQGENLAFHWPSISAELDKVPEIWDRYWTKKSLTEAIFNQTVQTWAAGPEGELRIFAFTQVANYPAGKKLQGLFIFGNGLNAALDVLVATFQKFAMVQGCVELELVGEAGWERLLRPFGFRKSAVVLSIRVPSTGVH